MDDNVIPFDRRLYVAKEFRSVTEQGSEFRASGTLCGSVDLVTPLTGTLCLTIPEIDALINILRDARQDVLANSDPFGDPRIVTRTI